MLPRPASLAPMAAAIFLSLPVGSGPASADVFLETAYLPTSSVLTLPSSSLVPTSYVVPSSSFVPTSTIYTTGDVVVPTYQSSLVPTYRAVRYRPRRYVERTAYYTSPSFSMAPTSYLAPTSYVVPTRFLSTSFVEPTSYLVDSGLVTTSASMSMCCESASGLASSSAPVPVPSPNRTTATRPSPSSGTGSLGNTITSTPATGTSNERMPTGTVNGAGPGEEEKSSAVVPPVGVTPAPVTPPTPPDSAAPAGVKQGDGPDPASIPMPKPGEAGSTQPPPVPKVDETLYRRSRRPAFNGTSETRNIFRGRVIAFDSGRPEEAVTVVLASKTGTFVDRTAMSDADGEFKVSLPEGDWVLKVKMPSGSLLPVGRDYFSAVGGKVIDSGGRDVNAFTINR